MFDNVSQKHETSNTSLCDNESKEKKVKFQKDHYKEQHIDGPSTSMKEDYYHALINVKHNHSVTQKKMKGVM